MEQQQTALSPLALGIFRGRGRGVPKVESEKMVGQSAKRDLNFNIICDSHSKNDTLGPDHCSFCNRPVKLIVCRSCGHTFNGRVRITCPHHPEVIHLMDSQGCPNCKGFNLKEFC